MEQQHRAGTICKIGATNDLVSGRVEVDVATYILDRALESSIVENERVHSEEESLLG
jgi:hypothetical protein